MNFKDSPQYYHQVLQKIPPRAHPVFEDEEMLQRVWGERWGVYNGVGTIKKILVHRPGDEIKRITADKYDPGIQAIIDVEEQWYWRNQEPPDLEKMRNEHDGLVKALESTGAEVINMEGCSEKDPKAMFVRDNAMVVPGGVVISRMGPAGEKPGTGRRGEEYHAMKMLAKLGMPILRTIHGDGLLEGGSFAFLDEKTALVGMALRQNESAARQLEEVLAVFGISLIRIPLTGYSLHLDGAFNLIDHKLALINATRLPYWFLELLKEKGIHVIDLHYADHYMAVNCLAVSPGKVIYAINNGQGTADKLVRAGVEVIPIEYRECQINGGSIHCSTLPLIRDRD